MKRACLALSFVWWSLAGAVSAAEPAGGEGAVLLPLGVADRAGTMGFFKGEKGGIDAVDLQTGKMLWQTKAAETPLIVQGNLLLAELRRGPTVKLIGFEVGTGKTILESEAIPLPEWAAGAGRGHSFESVAWIAGGELVYRWQAGTHYAGGAAPSPQLLAASAKSAAGVSRISLKTGKVTDVGEEKPPTAVAGRELENGGRKFSLEMGKQTADWHVPRRLRATDAASGKVIWEISVEPDFQPPPPP